MPSYEKLLGTAALGSPCLLDVLSAVSTGASGGAQHVYINPLQCGFSGVASGYTYHYLFRICFLFIYLYIFRDIAV